MAVWGNFKWPNCIASVIICDVPIVTSTQIRGDIVIKNDNWEKSLIVMVNALWERYHIDLLKIFYNAVRIFMLVLMRLPCLVWTIDQI